MSSSEAKVRRLGEAWEEKHMDAFFPLSITYDLDGAHIKSCKADFLVEGKTLDEAFIKLGAKVDATLLKERDDVNYGMFSDAGNKAVHECVMALFNAYKMDLGHKSIAAVADTHAALIDAVSEGEETDSAVRDSVYGAFEMLVNNDRDIDTSAVIDLLSDHYEEAMFRYDKKKREMEAKA